MRIIGGSFKGRKLKEPSDMNIRPTSDKVKEALFNILGQRLDGLKVLDLFSGSGALGIEAISRGATEAVFCDKDIKSVKLTKENLALINSDSRVINADCFTAINMLKGKIFDIIFCDPPYKENFSEKLLGSIYENKLLSDGGIIVYETASLNLPCVPLQYIIKDTRNYGKIKLSFIVQA